MWGFECGDRVLINGTKEGYIVKNFVGTTCFMVEEIKDNRRTGLFLVVDRSEIKKVEVL
jgi:hypothetical protein